MSRINPTCRKAVVGLVGGIGSGKSTVARIMEELGAAVVDFDRLAHAELSAEPVSVTLREWWGDSIFLDSGGVDRQAIAAIVFSDAQELARLEELLYPRLKERCVHILTGLEGQSEVRAVVLDAPKLLEAGLRDWCDAVIFVEADRGDRLVRVSQRHGWTSSELDRRENLQIPLDRKRASADYVVRNHSSIEHLRAEVGRVFKSVLASFTQVSR